MALQWIGHLLTRSTKEPERYMSGPARFVMVHWNGPSVLTNGYAGDIRQLQIDADWHVNHNGWDGLSYHYAIGRTGQEYQCRYYHTSLWHSGIKLFNDWAWAVHVITGEGDPISPEQFEGLRRRLNALGINRRYWLGHREGPKLTKCPGPLLERWLWNERMKVRQPAKTKVRFQANVRDMADVDSHLLGQLEPGREINGWWRLGKPWKGDSLWFELNGDRYIHASALYTTSYNG